MKTSIENESGHSSTAGGGVARSRVSVVIPLWNQPEYIIRALDSVYWQLEAGDEVIVVDDASTRKADPGLRERYGGRLRWLENSSNRGVGYSRNRGVLEARGEWIKFLDADDVLAPFVLTAIRPGGEGHVKRAQVLHGPFHRIIDREYADCLDDTDERLKHIAEHNPMVPSAIFVRRRALLAVGLFDEGIDFEEDWDLWFRLMEQYGMGGFVKLRQPVCYYWIEERERRAKRREAMRGDVTVREYFRQRYGASPEPYWRPPEGGSPL